MCSRMENHKVTLLCGWKFVIFGNFATLKGGKQTNFKKKTQKQDVCKSQGSSLCR